jgi:hypothetical protein
VAQFLAFLGMLSLVAAGFVEWYRPALVAGGLLLVVPFLLRFETTVDEHHLSMQVRPFWRRTIALSDLVATEVTIWDGQVGFFGGFSTRGSLAGALISSWEGDTSVGNRAVVLELRSGRHHQVGTFQPRRLIEVLEAATGRPLRRVPDGG